MYTGISVETSLVRKDYLMQAAVLSQILQWDNQRRSR